MYEYLPLITHLFPACGISVFTVWETEIGWWRIYAREAKEYSEALSEKKTKKR